MKTQAVASVKFKKLQRLLKLSHWQAIGLLESIWLFTIQNAKCGDIGRHQNEDIAAAIEWNDDPDQLIDALVASGWLDADGPHRLIVHDWYDHAPQFVTKSVNRQLGITDVNGRAIACSNGLKR